MRAGRSNGGIGVAVNSGWVRCVEMEEACP